MQLWSAWRVRVLAGAAVGIVSVAVGVWTMFHGSAPTPAATQNPVTAGPASSPKPDVRGGDAPAGTAPAGTPDATNPTIARPAPNTAPERPNTAPVQPNTAPEEATTPPEEAARQQQLERLRVDAERQLRTGQRASALQSAVQGLQLDPTDAALQSVLGSLLDDAASQARRARIKANNAKAVTFAPTAFSQGVTLEADATQSRAADTKETAIQSFWKATRLFELSAQEATAEQARLRQLEEGKAAAAACGPAGA